MAPDLKSKLAGLEKNLESAKERERVLMEKLTAEKILRKDVKNKHEELQKMHSLWTNKLVDTVERLTSQLIQMDMKSWRFTTNNHEVISAIDQVLRRFD